MALDQMTTRTPLFPTGTLVATPGVLAAFDRDPDQPELFDYIARHQRGDWGDVSRDDAAENVLSVREGYRILSSYALPDGTRIWIITENDRSATTALLPSEY